MKFIDATQDRETASATPDEVYAQLRNTFSARLRGDRARLTDLGVRLTQATTDGPYIFEEIRLFAHKLREEATLFQVVEVAKAARALELAAISASFKNASGAHPSVWLMIDILVDRLASVETPHNGSRLSTGQRAQADAGNIPFQSGRRTSSQ